MPTLKDLAGKRFGRLVVIKREENGKHGITRWLCKCDCGNETTKIRPYFKKSPIPSCGCADKERKIGNKYSLNNKNHNKNPTFEGFSGTLFGHYKRQSKRRRLEFSLSLEFFREIIKKECIYCGKLGNNILNQGGHGGRRQYAIFTFTGIDRIDSSKGYSENNCVPCCKTCNYAKRIMTQQEFYDWIDRVYNHIHREESNG